MYAFSLFLSAAERLFPQLDTGSIRDFHYLHDDLGLCEGDLEKLAAYLGDALGIIIADPAQFETVGELCEYIETYI